MAANFLPFFPLNLIAFPGETLKLHIFEPRYRQLVKECLADDKSFGIPPFVNNQLPGLGTEMCIEKLEREYTDGRMDIKCVGLRVFQIIDFQNPCKGKLYAGGNVEWQQNETDSDYFDPELAENIEELYKMIAEDPHFEKNDHLPLSYRFGHRIGLNIDGEYQLLATETELDRQIFLKNHLKTILPKLRDLERTRDRIRLNGHFQQFDPLDFEGLNLK
jgi:hypothetical protein